MRLDKFLKVSRLLKRRTVAKDLAAGGRASVDGRPVKPAYEVKVGDVISLRFGAEIVTFRVLSTDERVARRGIALYEIVERQD